MTINAPSGQSRQIKIKPKIFDPCFMWTGLTRNHVIVTFKNLKLRNTKSYHFLVEIKKCKMYDGSINFYFRLKDNNTVENNVKTKRLKI